MNGSPSSLLSPRNWVLAFFALVAASFTYWSTSLYGPGLSPDSAGYVHLAREIKSHGFAFLTENISVNQPPLYPLCIAATSSITGLSVVDSATWMNIFCASALVLVILFSVSKITSSFPVLLMMGTLSCCSVPFTVVWAMAWTEPLFILLVSLTLLTVNLPNGTQAALIGGLLTALACYTRYAGVAIIPAAAVFLLFSPCGSRWKRCKNVLYYAMPVCVLFTPYVARNYVVSGTLLGERTPSAIGFLENVMLTKDILLSWFLPPAITPNNPLQLLAFAAIAAAAWYHRGHIAYVIRHSGKLVYAFAAFGTTYIVFIIATSTSTAYDHINTRLLAPLYPSLLMMLTLLLKPESWGNSRLRQCALIACSVLCAASVVVTCLKLSRHAKTGAGGYNSVLWKNSELIRYFQQHGLQDETHIFSNMPDALYLLADIPATMSPAKKHHNSNQTTGLTTSNLFSVYPQLNGAILVWFEPNWRNFLYSHEELTHICQLNEIHSFEDGKIFRITQFTATTTDSP